MAILFTWDVRPSAVTKWLSGFTTKAADESAVFRSIPHYVRHVNKMPTTTLPKPWAMVQRIKNIYYPLVTRLTLERQALSAVRTQNVHCMRFYVVLRFCGPTRYVCDTVKKHPYKLFVYVVSTMHFGMKLCNDQRNEQVFNLYLYLLLPYMFRASFKLIFRGRCTISAMVQVSWVWCQRPGANTSSFHFI
jgi:hypothetical protein